MHHYRFLCELCGLCGRKMVFETGSGDSLRLFAENPEYYTSAMLKMPIGHSGSERALNREFLCELCVLCG